MSLTAPQIAKAGGGGCIPLPKSADLFKTPRGRREKSAYSPCRGGLPTRRRVWGDRLHGAGIIVRLQSLPIFGSLGSAYSHLREGPPHRIIAGNHTALCRVGFTDPVHALRSALDAHVAPRFDAQKVTEMRA